MELKILKEKVVITGINGSFVKNKPQFKIVDGCLEIDYHQLSDTKDIFVFIDDKEREIPQDLAASQYQQIDDLMVSCYLTKEKNLVIIKGIKFKTNSSLGITGISYLGTAVQFKLQLRTPNSDKITKIIFRERKTAVEFSLPLDHQQQVISCETALFSEVGIYDIYAEIKLSDKFSLIKRSNKTRLIHEMFFKNGNIIEGDGNRFIIEPYTTYKARNLSLKVRRVEVEAYDLLYKKNSNQSFLLIGEQPDKAQDNGYFLFKYLRENHPEVPAYYVIDENCSDFSKVYQLGNVIKFGTSEHFAIINQVKYFISTHHPDLLLPFTDKKLLEKKSVYKIFLQHGVMGTKYMANFYGKYANNPFDVDMFIVSSIREQKMIIEDFGYLPAEVKVTGLARFDNLFKEDEDLDIDILLIPTWRDWLQNNPEIETTDFYQNYLRLVKKLAGKYKVKYVLHTNMSQYKEQFRAEGIDALVATEVNVQSLIKRAKLMITDYSSVSFDFSFLKKPVIYYQFDQEKFFGKNGSHFDIYKELPGAICVSERDVIEKVKEIVADDYQQDVAMAKKSDNLIAYRDCNSAHRIYQEILNCNQKSKKSKFKTNSFAKRVLMSISNRTFKIFRKSPIYFRTMKLMFKFIKYLPKKDIVFLESSNGKSFSDSPREIYNEWTNRNPNQQFVLAYDQPFPKHMFKNIHVVGRLSPGYYYNLARSKYWINNQNFPHYIRNHKTMYVQTWHGTPLKKMLHDIEVVVGRDAGYVDRVSNAVKQWSYLVSPSEYATSCFRSAFNYQGEVLEYGYPRNDCYFKKSIISSKYYQQYLSMEKKVILVAPTFRDYGEKSGNKYMQDLMLDYQKMYEEFHEEYICIIKLHPLAENSKGVPLKYQDFFKISAVDEDINDLLQFTDILVTDYSSVMFDFLLSGKKTILYAWDFDSYTENRGFYLDMKTEAPGQVVTDFESLIAEIKNENINYDLAMLKQKFSSHETGNAAAAIVDFILKTGGNDGAEKS